MKIFFRIILTLVVISLVFAFGLIPIFSQMIIAKHSLPEIKEQLTLLAEKRVNVLGDLKALSDNPYFVRSPWKKNVESFMETSLEGSEANEGHKKVMKEILHIVDNERLSTTSEGQLLNFLSYPEWNRFDLNWFDEIQSYDHWNHYQSPRMKGRLEAIKGVNYLQQIEELKEIMVPRIIEMNSALFVRLSQLVSENDLDKAYKLLRKVIQININSTSMFSVLFAANLMEVESQLQRNYPYKKFETLDGETILKFKRSRFYLSSIIQTVFFKELPETDSMALNKQNGICSVLTISWRSILQNPYYFAEPFAMETDFTSHLKREKEFFSKWFHECGLGDFLFLFDKNTASNSWYLEVDRKVGDEARKIEFFNQSLIPYIRIPIHLRELRQSIKIYLDSIKEV